jgi:hypothetical protein
MSSHPESEKVAPKATEPNQPMVEKKENDDSGISSPAEASLNYQPERSGPPTTFWGKVGHWMGALPEWSVKGKKLAGKQLNFWIAFIASNGFLMFGYDQGVLSALITLRSWQEVFPLMTPRENPNELCWINGDRNQPDLNPMHWRRKHTGFRYRHLSNRMFPRCRGHPVLWREMGPQAFNLLG